MMEDTRAKIRIVHTLPDGTQLKHEGEFEMDQLKNLIGDGQAKVTFGHTESDKVYGTGADTFISVSATCNQDLATMSKVADILKNFVLQFLPGAHSEALATWKQNYGLNKEILEGVR